MMRDMKISLEKYHEKTLRKFGFNPKHPNRRRLETEKTKGFFMPNHNKGVDKKA